VSEFAFRMSSRDRKLAGGEMVSPADVDYDPEGEDYPDPLSTPDAVLQQYLQNYNSAKRNAEFDEKTQEGIDIIHSCMGDFFQTCSDPELGPDSLPGTGFILNILDLLGTPDGDNGISIVGSQKTSYWWNSLSDLGGDIAGGAKKAWNFAKEHPVETALGAGALLTGGALLPEALAGGVAAEGAAAAAGAGEAVAGEAAQLPGQLSLLGEGAQAAETAAPSITGPAQGFGNPALQTALKENPSNLISGIKDLAGKAVGFGKSSPFAMMSGMNAMQNMFGGGNDGGGQQQPIQTQVMEDPGYTGVTANNRYEMPVSHLEDNLMFESAAGGPKRKDNDIESLRAQVNAALVQWSKSGEVENRAEWWVYYSYSHEAETIAELQTILTAIPAQFHDSVLTAPMGDEDIVPGNTGLPEPSEPTGDSVLSPGDTSMSPVPMEGIGTAPKMPQNGSLIPGAMSSHDGLRIKPIFAEVNEDRFADYVEEDRAVLARVASYIESNAHEEDIVNVLAPSYGTEYVIWAIDQVSKTAIAEKFPEKGEHDGANPDEDEDEDETSNKLTPHNEITSSEKIAETEYMNQDLQHDEDASIVNPDVYIERKLFYEFSKMMMLFDTGNLEGLKDATDNVMNFLMEYQDKFNNNPNRSELGVQQLQSLFKLVTTLDQTLPPFVDASNRVCQGEDIKEIVEGYGASPEQWDDALNGIADIIQQIIQVFSINITERGDLGFDLANAKKMVENFAETGEAVSPLYIIKDDEREMGPEDERWLSQQGIAFPRSSSKTSDYTSLPNSPFAAAPAPYSAGYNETMGVSQELGGNPIMTPQAYSAGQQAAVAGLPPDPTVHAQNTAMQGQIAGLADQIGVSKDQAQKFLQQQNQQNQTQHPISDGHSPAQSQAGEKANTSLSQLPSATTSKVAVWKDVDGNMLKADQMYKMTSSEYEVPDFVRVLKNGDSLELRLSNNGMSLILDEKDIKKSDYQFEPIEENQKQSFFLSESALTSFEQRELIDENGSARNLDRLNLEGTHYVTYSQVDNSFDIINSDSPSHDLSLEDHDLFL
jgi:hypothetical protein